MTESMFCIFMPIIMTIAVRRSKANAIILTIIDEPWLFLYSLLSIIKALSWEPSFYTTLVKLASSEESFTNYWLSCKSYWWGLLILKASSPLFIEIFIEFCCYASDKVDWLVWNGCTSYPYPALRRWGVFWVCCRLNLFWRSKRPLPCLATAGYAPTLFTENWSSSSETWPTKKSSLFAGARTTVVLPLLTIAGFYSSCSNSVSKKLSFELLGLKWFVVGVCLILYS